MNRTTIFVGVLAIVAAGAPVALADYAVLRSGMRLHITGYEAAGDRVRLSVPGGMVEISAIDLVAVEPEDTFQARPTVVADPGAAAGPYGQLIRAASIKNGVDERLITHIIAAESCCSKLAITPVIANIPAKPRITHRIFLNARECTCGSLPHSEHCHSRQNPRGTIGM